MKTKKVNTQTEPKNCDTIAEPRKSIFGYKPDQSSFEKHSGLSMTVPNMNLEIDEILKRYLRDGLPPIQSNPEWLENEDFDDLPLTDPDWTVHDVIDYIKNVNYKLEQAKLDSQNLSPSKPESTNPS